MLRLLPCCTASSSENQVDSLELDMVGCTYTTAVGLAFERLPSPTTHLSSSREGLVSCEMGLIVKHIASNSSMIAVNKHIRSIKALRDVVIFQVHRAALLILPTVCAGYISWVDLSFPRPTPCFGGPHMVRRKRARFGLLFHCKIYKMTVSCCTISYGIWYHGIDNRYSTSLYLYTWKHR